MAVARRPGLCHEKRNMPQKHAGDRYQMVDRLYVAVRDTLGMYQLQGRHKLPNQGSSYIISPRFRLIRLQGALNEDDRVRLFLTANRFLSNFSW